MFCKGPCQEDPRQIYSRRYSKGMLVCRWRGGRTDLKLENKSRCIKYKRDGGTTIEPETQWATGDFGAGCKREYVRVLRLIGKVNKPEYMNTERESQCIKYERDVQLGEATRKARTGKVLKLARSRRG